MPQFVLSAFADEADNALDKQILALQDNRISYVEMRSLDGLNILDCDNAKLAEIKEKLKAGNVRLSSVGSPIGKIKITDDFAPHLDKFKRGLEIAQKLETQRIRIFSFYLPQDQDAEIFRDEVMERMTRFLDAAEGSGVFVCHENEKDIYGDIPRRVLDLHQTLGPRLKSVFDPANYILCGVTDILEAMTLLLPYIDYMHIKDARIRDYQIVPAGFGDGHIPELIQMLANIRGEHFITLEPHLSIFQGFAGLGDDSVIKENEEFKYGSNLEAFHAAVTAMKNVFINLNLKINNESGYEKWTK